VPAKTSEVGGSLVSVNTGRPASQVTTCISFIPFTCDQFFLFGTVGNSVVTEHNLKNFGSVGITVVCK
jgi:hypothetical protein